MRLIDFMGNKVLMSKHLGTIFWAFKQLSGSGEAWSWSRAASSLDLINPPEFHLYSFPFLPHNALLFGAWSYPPVMVRGDELFSPHLMTQSSVALNLWPFHCQDGRARLLLGMHCFLLFVCKCSGGVQLCYETQMV